MMEWLVSKLFWWTPLRTAIFAEVDLYNTVGYRLREHEKNGPTNLAWTEEDGLWRGWTFDSGKNMYKFDDLGGELMDLWDYLWDMNKSTGGAMDIVKPKHYRPVD